MTRTLVVGVDPGATTGICALAYNKDGSPRNRPAVWQCHEEGHAGELLRELVADHQTLGYEVVLAVEQFVVSARAAKSATAVAGRITRTLIAELDALCDAVDVRPAVLVKRWATDRRLDAAGLLTPTKGHPHARDAARHALYAAVNRKITRDPLSAKIEC